MFPPAVVMAKELHAAFPGVIVVCSSFRAVFISIIFFLLYEAVRNCR